MDSVFFKVFYLFFFSVKFKLIGQKDGYVSLYVNCVFNYLARDPINWAT